MCDDSKKQGNKPPFELLEPAFLEAMALAMQTGLKNGRNAGDWKRLDPIKYLPTYRGALFRHVIASDPYAAFDGSGVAHYPFIATNAMICMYLESRIPEYPLGASLAELARLWGVSIDDARIEVLRLAELIGSDKNR